eukprot:15483325-Alexandrium_andersonii.AAC.1
MSLRFCGFEVGEGSVATLLFVERVAVWEDVLGVSVRRGGVGCVGGGVRDVSGLVSWGLVGGRVVRIYL